MYANMFSKIVKYAVTYAIIFIFELKIFNPFNQRFSTSTQGSEYGKCAGSLKSH